MMVEYRKLPDGRVVAEGWWLCGCGELQSRGELWCDACRDDKSDGDPVELGEFYRLLRERAGLTKAKLSRRTGIHRITLRRLEIGKRIPHAATLRALDDELLGRNHQVREAVLRVVNKALAGPKLRRGEDR